MLLFLHLLANHTIYVLRSAQIMHYQRRMSLYSASFPSNYERNVTLMSHNVTLFFILSFIAQRDKHIINIL